MALDFPNSPTLNQTFTAPNGTIWLWDGVKWTATTSTSPFTGQGNVGRNLLHNPLFNVAQRGAGPWTTNVYALDRWVIGTNLDTYSFTQGHPNDTDRTQIGDEAATNSLVNAFTGNAGAGSLTSIAQPIESVRRLAGKSVTVSFYAAATGALKLGCSLDQIFGTGGSPSAAVNGNGQSVTLTTTWARYSLTFTVPSASGKTLGTNNNDATWLNFWYSAGTTFASRSGAVGVQSGTVALWGVQLEIGSIATPLEKPDPRYDLSNCQRFYQLYNSGARVYATGAVTMSSPASWSTMHHTPTAVLSAAGIQSNTTGPYSITPNSIYGGYFQCASVGAGDAYALNYLFGLSADL